jgi:hypothetical protein
MIHPATELKFVNEVIGYGVFATSRIPRGTMTYVKDELEICISSARFDQLKPSLREQVEKYSYKTRQQTRIISWDIAKYMNHSCHANSMSSGWGFEIALRDISAGEEITDEYGLFNMEYAFPLSCNEPGCRGMLYPDDVLVYGELWDEQLRLALDDFLTVEQPLLGVSGWEGKKILEFYLSSGEGYRSVRSLCAPRRDTACIR